MVTTDAMEDGCIKLSDTVKQAIFLISLNILTFLTFRVVELLMLVIWPKEIKASIM